LLAVGATPALQARRQFPLILPSLAHAGCLSARSIIAWPSPAALPSGWLPAGNLPRASLSLKKRNCFNPAQKGSKPFASPDSRTQGFSCAVLIVSPKIRR
jgi:hypothetical protein